MHDPAVIDQAVQWFEAITRGSFLPGEIQREIGGQHSDDD